MTAFQTRSKPLDNPDDMFAEINPLPRLLMGPGPINADPRVLRAMGSQLLGQFDPQFRGYMKETHLLLQLETSRSGTCQSKTFMPQ